jgi:transposase
MADHKLDLPFWEGFTFTVSQLERTPGVTRITLLPQDCHIAQCSGCGQRSERVHEQGWRTIRYLPMLGDAVWLRMRLRRVPRVGCGPRTERVGWLDRHARITRRLAEFVGHWCEKLPVAHVCELSGLHWETVRRIDARRLQAHLEALPEAQPCRPVMDEFALYKGHRYATVVMDADTRRVLWVGEGRSREAIRPLFDWLGVERCKHIEAVAMDMNTAFDLEVQQHFPNDAACLRLVRALCSETHETWLEDSRYLNMALLAEQKNEFLCAAADTAKTTQPKPSSPLFAQLDAHNS